MKSYTKGNFEKAEYDQYLASDGHIYSVGDTIKFGRPSSNKIFAFVQEGSGIMTESSNADIKASGTTSTIKKIYIGGTKKMGFKVYFMGKGICDFCPKYYIDVEQAFATNELESKGMTKDKAISKLKEAKDLVELGVMSKEEFEKLRAELTPIITGGK
jgi:hypothetical protein